MVSWLLGRIPRVAGTPWVVAALAALAYPWLLDLAHAGVLATDRTGPGLGTLGAVAGLVGAFAVPALAFAAVRRSSRRPGSFDVRGLRVAHLALTAPALFSAVGVLSLLLGVREHERAVWLGLWLATIAGAWALPRSRPRPPSQERRAHRARVAHGIAALVVCAGFLLWHLGNHAVALVGADAHRQVMELLRAAYRSPWVEPGLIFAFAVVLATGTWLAVCHTARRQDLYRSAQTAAGVYLGVFILSHATAIFVLARATLGIETDWAFAASEPTGLLRGAFAIRLIPYYALSVFLTAVHVGIGARGVLREHGAGDALTRGLVVAAIAVGGLAAALITLALCGVRLA